jgi:hypothetical protein
MYNTNYGSGISQDVVTNVEKTILEYQARYKTGYIGRSLVAERPNVPPLTRRDIVRHVDKAKASDGISRARISLGGTAPEEVGGKVKDKLHQIHRVDIAIRKNEAALNADPTAWNSDTNIAMLECQKRENYMIIAGDTTFGITGLSGVGAANSRGSITSSTNNGAWDGSETDHIMDPYADLVKALDYVDPELVGELYLGGRPAYMNLLLQEDDLGKIWADKIGGRIFGRPLGDTSWMVKSDYWPANYVYLVCKTAQATELLIPEDYALDADYPREKGQNVYAEIGGWIGFEVHNNASVVRIAIN